MAQAPFVSNSNPGFDAVAITPSDTVSIAAMVRGIYVGGTGDVTVLTAGGSTVKFSAVPVGVTLPICATRVNLTGTTATLLVGVY